MNQDTDQFIYAIRAIWLVIALVALPGIYPARKLSKSTKPTARATFWIIIVLTAVAPVLFLIYDRMRLHMLELDSPSSLKGMPVPMDGLPLMYIMSAAASAIILWIVFAWHVRTKA